MLLRKFGLGLVGTVVLSLIVAACGSASPTAVPTKPPATAAPTATTPAGATAAPTAAATVAPTATRPAPTAAPTNTPVPRPTATAAPVASGELIFAASSIPVGLTPHIRGDGSHVGLYDYLMGTKAEGPFDPAQSFIQSWTANADSSAYTFKVRTDVVFHNGNKASSADFAYAIERGTDAKSQWPNGGALRATIKTIQTPDDTTLVANLASPSIFWAIGNISRNRTNTSMPVVLLDKKYLSSVGDDAASKAPIGSSPYKFKSYTASDRFVLEAIDGKHFFFGVPRTKTLTTLAIPESATRLALLKTKSADLASISGSDVKTMTDAGLLINRRQSSQWGLLYNAQFPDVIPGYGPNPLANKTVRQALYWYAIDRKSLVDNFLRGYGAASTDYPVAKPDPAYVGTPVPAYDPAKAKAMLAQAGFAKMEIDLWVGTANALPEAVDIMEAIAAWWQGVGVTVNRKPFTGTAFTLALNNAYKSSWPKPTVQGLIYSGALVETSATAILLQSNVDAIYHVTADPELQRLNLLVQAAKTLDEYKTTAQAYQKYAYEQASTFVMLFEGDDIYASSPKVGKTWKLGKDSQTIRIEAAAALP